jgi:hypothetical protein
MHPRRSAPTRQTSSFVAPGPPPAYAANTPTPDPRAVKPIRWSGPTPSTVPGIRAGATRKGMLEVLDAAQQRGRQLVTVRGAGYQLETA